MKAIFILARRAAKAIGAAMPKARRLVGLLLIPALCSCMTLANLDPKDNLAAADDEGVVIIGVPQNTAVLIYQGEVKDGKFHHFQLELPHGIMGPPAGGYYIRKLPASKPGQGYALTGITYLGRDYVVNCKQQMALLTVRPGQVQYFFDAEVLKTGAGILPSLNTDLAAARKYVRAQYPRFAGEIVPGQVDTVEQTRCNVPGTIVIPIYVPRSR
jgi:hypothetical protein